MAKRRRSRTKTVTRTVRVGSPRAAAPIVKVNVPRSSAPVRRRRRSGGRRRSSGLSLGMGNGIVGMVAAHALGGAIFGFAVQQGWVGKLPAIPVLGRTGTAALGLAYFSKHGGGEIARKAAVAAATLAGYQLGTQGSVTGQRAFDVGDDGESDDDGEYEMYEEATG